MYICNIAFNLAKDRHPEEINFIESKLRSGESIHKNSDLDKLTYKYNMSVKIKSVSHEVIFGYKPYIKPQIALEKEIDILYKNSLTTLSASIGRWIITTDVDKDLVPELKEYYKQKYNNILIKNIIE